jgi:hypothetical protein
MWVWVPQALQIPVVGALIAVVVAAVVAEAVINQAARAAAQAAEPDKVLAVPGAEAGEAAVAAGIGIWTGGHQ